MPNLPVDGFAQAFQSFFEIGPVSWGLAMIIGGSIAAFIVRLLISAFWR